MANKGMTDKDLGLKDILKEVEKLKSMCVKVGVTEDVGSNKGVHRVSKAGKNGKKTKRKVKVENTNGPTIAQYAARNELGVLGPPVSQHGQGKWFIPPRPFVRGWADGRREQIAKTMEKFGRQITSGLYGASTIIRRLGEYGQGGVKSYIRNGPHIENADSTKRRKGSSKPLIDTGTLRNSIRFQIIERPVDAESGK
ncbi:MAG: hypothetical protein LBH73_01650 [Spirochaetaceae bacterium]|jgi:hypothetical protein|nr:hypothetical protein [Spirochaetaceae bacterium]